MSETALELINATKRFNGALAVDALSFSVQQGEIIGFLGPNGAGKSTSLRMALGVITPDEGQAHLFGQRPDLRALQRVGFLPEERGLYRRMSTKAVIAYFARLKGMSLKDANARAEALLEAHGLGAYKASRISRLSKGMAQKVQILCTLVHSPDLIILDEPFSGLDPVNQQDLESLIHEEHTRGATIVFSTHVMEHAERLCDRLLIIGAGQKKFEGTLGEALSLIPQSAVMSVSDDRDIASVFVPHGYVATKHSDDENGVNWHIGLPENGSPQHVLRLAIDADLAITGFTPQQTRLRDVFVKLTSDTAFVRDSVRNAQEAGS